MDKRQTDLLDSLVEAIAYRSVVRLSQRQLRHLHGAERLGKNAWRDLEERLPNGLTAKDVSIIKEDDDIYLVRKAAVDDMANWV